MQDIRSTICLFALLSLAGCGAREARPVQEASALDDRLTCDHIQGERATNAARLQELTKENDERGARNVAVVLGFGLIGALAFADTGSAQRTEIEAIGRRNARLDELASARGCPAAPVSPAPDPVSRT